MLLWSFLLLITRLLLHRWNTQLVCVIHIRAMHNFSSLSLNSLKSLSSRGSTNMCSYNKRIPDGLQILDWNLCKVTRFREGGNRRKSSNAAERFYCESSANPAQYSLIYPRRSTFPSAPELNCWLMANIHFIHFRIEPLPLDFFCGRIKVNRLIKWFLGEVARARKVAWQFDLVGGIDSILVPACLLQNRKSGI